MNLKQLIERIENLEHQLEDLSILIYKKKILFQI